MRVVWAGSGGWGRGHSNVTMHINGSLGRVIDTKLFRTHLSRRTETADVLYAATRMRYTE